MENHSRKTFGGGSEALWGRALPQIGKMRFRSCVGGDCLSSLVRVKIWNSVIKANVYNK